MQFLGALVSSSAPLRTLSTIMSLNKCVTHPRARHAAAKRAHTGLDASHDSALAAVPRPCLLLLL